jgi:hypothetical protein
MVKAFEQPDELSKRSDDYRWHISAMGFIQKQGGGIKLEQWFTDVSWSDALAFARVQLGNDFGGIVCVYARILGRDLGDVGEPYREQFAPWNRGRHGLYSIKIED